MNSPPAQPNESETIARAKQGDKQAYRLLVETYQDRLFGLVYSMVRNQEQAEDLTQEIFVKAYFALRSFAGDSAFYTWLFRIGSNHCLDHLRKRRPQEISLDDTTDEAETLTRLQSLEAPASERPDVPQQADSEVMRVLATLDPDQRLVLSLREVEGCTYEEIAKLMNCGVNTVKSRLNRAREAFKTAYIYKFGNILEAKTVQKGEEIP